MEDMPPPPLSEHPKVREAKQLLLEALKSRQQRVTSVAPPKPALAKDYQHLLEHLEKVRGAKLWYPYLGTGVGSGALVELLDGSVKYDFIGGIGVHHFGHSHPAILSACIDAALSDLVMQGHLQQNTDQKKLMETLVEITGLPYCFLTTSGSMANENALKIALQKNFPARRILAFERCFVGRTLACSQITEKPAVRENIPQRLGVDYIPFFDPENPEASTEASVKQLKKHIWRHPKDHALMVFEMIQGEGGFYSGSAEFFRAIIDILKENRIATLVDEVQTFGRTSRFFAFQHFGLEGLVDMVSIGKLAQVAATLFTEEYAPKPGLLSQTFSSSTSAIHASQTIIDVMRSGDFFGNDGMNMRIHRHLVKNFEAMRSRHPHLVRGPYGLGAMFAFTPLDGDVYTVTAFGKRLFDEGVISFICGKEPTRIRFLPPVGAVTEEDIDNASEIVEKTLYKFI